MNVRALIAIASLAITAALGCSTVGEDGTDEPSTSVDGTKETKEGPTGTVQQPMRNACTLDQALACCKQCGNSGTTSCCGACWDLFDLCNSH